MTNASKRRKVTPQANQGMPPEFVIGGAIIGILLVIIAALAATGDDQDPNAIAEPTPVPLPTYEGGNTLAVGDTLYAIEELNFSVAAGEDLENEDLTIGECTEVTVRELPQDPDAEQAVNTIVGYSESGYWVYAMVTLNESVNGWLPLDKLSQEVPEGCES